MKNELMAVSESVNRCRWECVSCFQPVPLGPHCLKIKLELKFVLIFVVATLLGCRAAMQQRLRLSSNLIDHSFSLFSAAGLMLVLSTFAQLDAGIITSSPWGSSWC